MYCDSKRPDGLGLIPGVALIGTAVTEAGVIGSAFDAAGSVFGWGHDWEEDALAGKIECQGPYTPEQVYRALQVAPRGVPGMVGPGGPNDQTMGTVEGARVALEVHPDFVDEFAPQSLRELANALVYVAHGAEDCDTSDWKDVPAQDHVQALVQRAAAAGAYAGGGGAPAPGPTPGYWEPPIPVNWGAPPAPAGPPPTVPEYPPAEHEDELPVALIAGIGALMFVMTQFAGKGRR